MRLRRGEGLVQLDAARGGPNPQDDGLPGPDPRPSARCRRARLRTRRSSLGRRGRRRRRLARHSQRLGPGNPGRRRAAGAALAASPKSSLRGVRPSRVQIVGPKDLLAMIIDFPSAKLGHQARGPKRRRLSRHIPRGLFGRHAALDQIGHIASDRKNRHHESVRIAQGRYCEVGIA